MEASQHGRARSRRAIYDDAVRFYEACGGQSNLSDTWVHSLKRKGSRYSFDEMLKMRRPGSFVTLHINVFDYFVDKTRVDEGNAVVAKLLQCGESDVGEPLQDVTIGGRRFSSVYLKHLAIAAEMIGYLSAKGIERPTLLEIGGGQGLLLAALRNWYGDKLTIIAADIPETAFYQAYFLMATFPEVPATFRPTEAPVEIARGGFNFVNAYVLASQRYDIDVAINANSMQEMSGGVANAYLAYIDQVVRPNGTLFFRNSFGHAVDSVPEPSEYDFGPRWKLAAADYGDFFTDSSATEFASFVFDRTAEPLNEESRRLVLRALWNGFSGGRFLPGAEVAGRLAAIDVRRGPAVTAREIETLLSPSGERWGGAVVTGMHLPQSVYAEPRDPADLAGGSARWRRAAAVWTMQKRLAAAMETSPEKPVAETRKAVELLVEDFLTASTRADVLASDYWSGYAASILVGLGHGAAASPLLAARLRRCDNVYWRLRFAWLLARAGSPAEAVQSLKTLSPGDLDVFWWPMAALLAHELGDAAAAASWLDAAAREAGAQGTDELRLCLFRANVRIDRLDHAARWFDDLSDENEARRQGNRLNLVATMMRLRPKDLPHARDLFYRLQPPPTLSPALAPVLFKLGEKVLGGEMARGLAQDNWDSYYTLGGIARVLLSIGHHREAERCMVRSAELRPGSIRHYDFLANLCFDNDQFDLAARWFGELLKGKPYDDVYRGRWAYARLLPDIRESGVFGRPEDQAMIFQTYQSFYYPDGPQIR